ncbi:hypothetical protein [Mucilaginibacter sp.]
MNKQLYTILLLVMVVVSYFHIQPVVLGLSAVVIFMPLKNHFAAIKVIRLFALLMVPVLLGLIIGLHNDTYLVFKDLYYFTMPVFIILSGILLACHMEIGQFLKTLVYAGVVTSIMVTAISVSYMGVGALADPYAAHYAIGIVGTPGPPVALACLLLTKKLDIKLFSTFWFRFFVAINTLGIYMFASRSYFIITLCFLILMIADRIKKSWIIPVIAVIAMIDMVIPSDLFKTSSSSTFTDKIINSFGEVTIGNYSTEQDINLRYRGYETFMALNSYAEGTEPEQLFGGLGKLVDLKTFIHLGEDADFRYIPVLHNGWMYLLVKTGITGVLTYLLVFFGLIVTNWRKYTQFANPPIIRLFAALNIGCVISLLITNYIITSFFNVEMSVLMVTLGYSFYYINYLSAIQNDYEY